MTIRLHPLVAASALSVLLAGGAQATELAVVGSWSSLPLHQKYEKRFWTETLPAASNGEISVQMTTFDQMGIKGSDVYRLLSDGVFDVGMTVADYTVGDAPELEGLDVPLIATSAESAQTMVEAARPMVADIMKQRFNAQLLAIAPYPPQVVFCKEEVSSLEDLKGRKVRGSGRMTTKLLEAMGAVGVNVSFAEVPGALERGVVDCAVTGAGSGYSAGWWEVSSYLLTLPLGGWDPVVTAVNLEKWKSLPPEHQELIRSEIVSAFEKPAWEAAAGSFENDIACLTGSGDCPAGTAADMVLVEPSKEDVATARAILTKTVLPDWGERAGDVWVRRWNASVGQSVGIEIPVQ